MPTTSIGRLAPPEEWAVIRLGAIGDVVLSTGVLNYWGEKFGLRFTVFTKKGLGDIFQNHPAVKEVVELDLSGLGFMDTMKLFSELSRRHKGKGLLDLHGNLRTRWLSSVWQGPVRRYPKFALERRIFLRVKNILPESKLWQALSNSTVPQRYASTLEDAAVPASLLKPVMFLEESEISEALTLLRQTISAVEATDAIHTESLAGIMSPPSLPRIVALHPYASHSPKSWPTEHWHALTKLLDAARIPWVCLGRAPQPFFGTANDLSNRTTLRQTTALLKLCSLLVTPDSGPMHLARAANTQILALFGPTVREWGFYPEPDEGRVLESRLPCRPCSLHGKKACPLPKTDNCLFQITPEDVLKNITEMLGCANR